MGFLSNLVDAVSSFDPIKTGYGIYQDLRDFNWKQHVQQETWDREDNGVQRRMADLMAAGLNPNLAAGSAASAGAVVGGSSHEVSGLGSILDMKMALEKLKQSREETEAMKLANKKTSLENRYLNYQNELIHLDWSDREDAWQYLHGNGARLDVYDTNGNVTGTKHFKYYSEDDSKRLPMFYQNLWRNNRDGINSSDILQKRNNFYTSDEMMKIVSGLFGAVGNFVPLMKGK